MAFDISAVFKNSFISLFTDPFIFGLAVIYTAISILFGFSVSAIGLKAVTVSNPSFPLSDLVYLLLYSVLFFLAITFITGVTFLRISGKKKDINSVLNTAVKRYPALLGTTILTGLMVAAGLIAFVIPGVYLAFKLIIAPVSSVIEKKGPVDAIRRSWSLTTGNWWYLFALFLLLGIIVSVIGLLPYISYFFAFVIVIAYPFVFMAVIPHAKRKSRS
jgi:hypothetical protein